MFGKLLKYEWKSNYKLFGLLSLIALGVGLVGGVLLRAVFIMPDMLENEFALAMSEMSLLSTVMLCFGGIALYSGAVQFINYYRFYKHKFTDEGYLTFTLPVKAESIFWSSFLNIFFWMEIAGCVAGLATLIMTVIGIVPSIVEMIREALQEVGPITLPEITLDMWLEVLKQMWNAMSEEIVVGFAQTGAPLYYVLVMLQTWIAPFYGILLTMTCIVVGSVLVKKMKLLVSVGIYLAFTSIVATLTQISVYAPSMAAAFDYNHYFYWMSIPMAGQILLQLGVIIGGYFLCIHLMKKKLNLP